MSLKKFENNLKKSLDYKQDLIKFEDKSILDKKNEQILSNEILKPSKSLNKSDSLDVLNNFDSYDEDSFSNYRIPEKSNYNHNYDYSPIDENRAYMLSRKQKERPSPTPARPKSLQVGQTPDITNRMLQYHSETIPQINDDPSIVAFSANPHTILSIKTSKLIDYLKSNIKYQNNF